MPICEVSGTDLKYFLICYDADGRERVDDPSGLMSKNVLERLRSSGQAITDIFFLSHGWKGDILAAIDQYDRWIKTMLQCPADIKVAHEKYPGFTPLIIGLHWPSLPWGDEELGGTVSYSLGATESVEHLISSYAERLSTTTKARHALETIFNAALVDIEPDQLPSEVRDAYMTLEQETGLSSEGVASKPGADRDRFDPEVIYEEAQELATDIVSFGGAEVGGLLLAPLRQLSFWKMKDRARNFGERGAHSLLKTLQADSSTRKIRFHGMGHSFGCIVMSGMLAGPPEGSSLERPLDSIMLVQGALSLWSYCSEIPFNLREPGYFHSIIKEQRVKGPTITTQSRFDTAVGRIYPLGAAAKSQVSFEGSEFPRYGGLGAYGVRGPGLSLIDESMLPVDQRYDFQRGKIYNLASDSYIKQGGGISGAHSDICHPEVAHAMWSGVISS